MTNGLKLSLTSVNEKSVEELNGNYESEGEKEEEKSRFLLHSWCHWCKIKSFSPVFLDQIFTAPEIIAYYYYLFIPSTI